MTMMQTIQQWDIDTTENLAAFERESLQVLQKVDRAVYRRVLVTDMEYLMNPYCDREEFIHWLTTRMRDIGNITSQGRRGGVIVEVTLVHRDGRPVRAEF